MKAIPVTELRQRTAELLDSLKESDEPLVILQRSRKTAYLVDAAQYEAQLAELRAARRQLFMREVREAEAEYAAGNARDYESIDSLLADLRD
jgi:prevent-host-death family protein